MRARSVRFAAGVVTLTAGILALPASLATAVTGQHAHATTSGGTGTWTWTQGVHLAAGKTYSLTDIKAKQAAVNASQRAQELKLDPAPTDKPATAKPAATVTPFTVASGYVMHDPGYRRDDHNYDSNWWSVSEEYCTSNGCKVTGTWKTQLHEWVQGTSSKLWSLKMSVAFESGQDDSIAYPYYYMCAINVANNPDHYCKNGADPNVSDEYFSPPTTIFKYFENNDYFNKEYPMVAIGIETTHNTMWTLYRGLDVCATASRTKLCPMP